MSREGGRQRQNFSSNRPPSNTHSVLRPSPADQTQAAASPPFPRACSEEKELREGGREGRKDRREGGQRRIGKCRVEMHLRFFVREIRAEPPPPQQRRRRHKRAGHAATPATRTHWLRLVPRPEFGARECFRIQLEKWAKVRWPRPPRPARPPPTIRSHRQRARRDDGSEMILQ